MEIPPIEKASVVAISHNEIGLFIVLATKQDAVKFDSAMSDYSIGWVIKEDNNVEFFLRSPDIGAYSFNCDIFNKDQLEGVNVVTASYRSETGQLEYIHPYPLNRIFHPKN
jgi:hypothetical protein